MRIPTRLLRFILLLMVVVGSPLSAQRVSRATAQSPVVTLERIAPKQWRATYHFAQPLTVLRFDRPAGFFRERVWKVITAGYKLTREGDWQLLTLESGATPSADIVVEFPEFTDPLPKEYELFQPFSDGAFAVYTGHFHARGTGATASDTSSVQLLRILTMAGEHAIVKGQLARGIVELRDSESEGTYVYIGKARQVETRDVIAIVDPGMPAWLRENFERNLPQLFKEYASLFGSALPWKPVVLFSFDERGSGTSSGGGTLGGMVNMTLSGSAWRDQTPARLEQAFLLIAHESAHLWNGGLVNNRTSSAGAWMHEGAADAIGTAMLRRFGVIDSAQYRARKEGAINRCSAALTTGSVATALSRGQVRTVYDCGFVMAMWTEAVVGGTPDKDLFSFWRELIAEAKGHGNSYDDSLYFDVLRKRGASNAVIARMQSFLVNRDSISIAASGLQAAGVDVREGTGTPPASYQLDLARAAMLHLMQQACGRASFNWGTTVRTLPVASCAPFSNEMQIASIGGKRIATDGAALHDVVRSACASGGSVKLEGESGTLLSSVPCTKPLAAPWKWYVLER